MSFFLIGNAIVKLREIALAHAVTELTQTARFFGNGDGKDGFAAFTELCPFCNKAEGRGFQLLEVL
jgi:hypothetical protein